MKKCFYPIVLGISICATTSLFSMNHKVEKEENYNLGGLHTIEYRLRENNGGGHSSQRMKSNTTGIISWEGKIIYPNVNEFDAMTFDPISTEESQVLWFELKAQYEAQI